MGKNDPKSIGMHHLRPLNSKIFWGRTPTPPCKTIPSNLPLTIRRHCPPSLALRTFQTFWLKPILTPDMPSLVITCFAPLLSHVSWFYEVTDHCLWYINEGIEPLWTQEPTCVTYHMPHFSLECGFSVHVDLTKKTTLVVGSPISVINGI